jgi:hypothetical protein
MSDYDEFYSHIKQDLTESYVPLDPNNIEQINKGYYADLHIHSHYSTDGYMKIEQIVKRCMENGVEWASVTDHNSFEAIKNLRKSERNNCHHTFFNYDGVKIFTGCEVSCIMPISEDKHIKLHVVCYGFNVDSDNIFLHLLSMKDKDYTRARYYSLFYLANKDAKYNTSLSEFKLFEDKQASKENFNGRINYQETLDFYKWKGIPEEEIVKDLQGFDFTNPERDRIRLNVVDVINAVHSAGGYCAVAHPTLSLEKYRINYCKNIRPIPFYTAITDKLLNVGMDGVEIANKTDDITKTYNRLYSDCFLRSLGTDTHYYGQNSRSDIGIYPNVEDVKNQNAINRLLDLEKAKNLQSRTKRQKQTAKIDNQNTFVEHFER